MSLVTYAIESPAAVITLNRADKRNALSRALIAALADAFARAADDAQARCAILAAAGPVFCAGMDLAELEEALDAAERSGEPLGAVWENALLLARLYDQIYAFPKPTIAVVQGAAVAGGAGLVSVCDLAAAAPDARFGYPEVRRGLVAAMVMPHLMRHVGERMARYLLLTGELIDAAEALRVGFINAIVPSEKLREQAQAWASAVAEGGPNAITQTKKLLRDFSHQALSVEQAAHESGAPRLSEECRQGLRAFFAKERPPWTAGD
ncbi:MAG: enoyl-CoA hydratase-related protein [Gemmataceae bacterium]|nr:enoyl-CoA hydratase-related protein [Gemmataceae bacterium]